MRAAIDSGVFAALRELESLDGGRAVQVVYVALMRRLPNVIPDRRRIAIDTGVSESSVKRAIGLLESASLIRVKRAKGRSSVYHLADLRVAEVATSCMKGIRDLVHGTEVRPRRSTSGSTVRGSRVTSGSSPAVTREPTVGSQVVQKEAIKISTKQQGAACLNVRRGELETERVLSRWGLSSARYLITPGDERAIPELAENPDRAASILDATLRTASWSASAGVGAKVAFLRENVSCMVSKLKAAEDKRECKLQHAKQRASKIAAHLATPNGQERRELEGEHFRELLDRGLERLGESDEVLRFLRSDETVRRNVVADELRRDALEREVRGMSEVEFALCCERMFAAQPGLRRIFTGAARESTGLRLRVIEFLSSQKRFTSRRTDEIVGVVPDAAIATPSETALLLE